jgi:hypothetical protein
MPHYETNHCQKEMERTMNNMMSNWNVYTFLLFMFLFIQNLFSQQDSTVILYYKNVPKHFIDMPCRDIENCTEKVKRAYSSQDTLYVLYDVDTLKIRNVSVIDGYTNKKHHYKVSMIIPPKNRQNKFSYIVIQWGNITYLFKKRKSYYIFQHKGIHSINMY